MYDHIKVSLHSIIESFNTFVTIQAANLAGFCASEDPRFYERNPKFFNTF